jgi:hypothetical protein
VNITLDGFTAGGQFTGQAPIVSGVELIVTNVKGWWGTPSLRTERTPRTNGPGSYRGPAYSNDRSIEVTVVATSVALSGFAMRTLERQVAALCNDPDALYLMTVTDELGTTAAYVERDGDIDPQPRDGLFYSSVFSIPVCAVDPRRLGLSWVTATAPVASAGSGGIVTSGSGIVTTSPGISTGTAGVVPTATIVGSGTARQLPLVFQLEGPGGDLVINDSRGPLVSYRGALGDSDTVWINADSQDAYDVPGAPGPVPAHGAILDSGGDARSAVSVRGGWPTLAPSELASFTLGGVSTTGAQLMVHTRPAYT